MITDPMLRLNEELVNRIRAHGVECYPHECCGALLGRDAESVREVLDLLPLENRHGASPRNRFTILPDDFRHAEKVARERGLDPVGWYHSHPDHPALPSEFDRAHAWPWYSYVIVSVEQRQPGQVTSWRLAEDRARFMPERMEIAARTRV
ncbi:MAG: M67 family metallopeptidase [Acidobacteria bacterium]|nr:M67 family metallopeptidase [Acidobacteriota bacterium]